MGLQFMERRLPREAPTPEEIRAMAVRLPGGVHDLVAVRSRYWSSQGIDPNTLEDEDMVRELAANPLALRRPILLKPGGEIVIGYRAGQYE